MKRFFLPAFSVILVLSVAACAGKPEEAPFTQEPIQQQETPPLVIAEPEPELFPGKICIITGTVASDEESYLVAQQVADKYGADKIIHFTWPSGGEMTKESTLLGPDKIVGDADIKALVINPALPHTNMLVDSLLTTRDDIFIIYCITAYYHQDELAEAAQRADLVLAQDEVAMGAAMVEQAYNMGAKTFVYYYLPRHNMGYPLLSAQHETLREKCVKLGLEFIYAEAADPTSDVGISGASEFILVDVPKQVAKYGVDTAFFSTNCGLQASLISAVTEQGAIYPQPCHPSPYHGFPFALGVNVPNEGLADREYLISETARILKEKGMLGRVSTWPVSVAMMSTEVSVEYAIKRLKDEVTQEGIDVDVLQQLMENYAGVECFIRPYVEEDGTEYSNYLLVREGYLTYSEVDIRE